MSNWFADVLDNVGTALNLPEFGLSETVNKGNATANTGRVAYDPSLTSGATLQPYLSALGSSGQASGGGAAPAAGGVNTQAIVTPEAQAQATAQAQQAAKAGALRGDITTLANSIKDIFNSRYGQVDANAGEQVGKLNDRFGTESQDITQQVAGEGQKVGAAAAATGSYDSSYRGNNVDTITKAGEGQVRDLGTELSDNLNKIAQWVSSQKAGFDANKTGIDQIVSRLAQETDPGNLATIRNTLEGRVADLRSTSADNNTAAQNATTLAAIAPSSPRAQQLKTTLSSILGGNADKGQKSAIAQKLISSAGLSGADSQQLIDAFNNELNGSDDKEQQLA